jgi:hypothetical protein
MSPLLQVWLAIFIGLFNCNIIAAQEQTKSMPHVFFRPRQAIYTSQARWLASFVYDFSKFEDYVANVERNIAQTRLLAENILREYNTSVYPKSKQPPSALRRHFNVSRKEPYVALFGLQLGEINALSSRFQEKCADFRQMIDLLNSGKNRGKRSLLPLGNLLSFVFGVSSESELNKIKQEIVKLAKTQDQVIHAVEDGFSVINVSRSLIQENRQTINQLINVSKHLQNELAVITQSIALLLPFKRFVLAHLQVQHGLATLTSMVKQANAHIDEIINKIDLLTLGHLSTEIVHPAELLGVLDEIQKTLPNSLKIAKKYLCSVVLL